MSVSLEHGFDAVALLGFEWLRPWGFLALLAPLLLLLFLRRPKPPRTEATGTLELWRRVEGEELASSVRTRHGLSWRAWLLCAALVLAALAVAGPRRERAPERERWRVIVDRSPSMYLPRRVGETETRYDVALAAALAILDEKTSEGAEVRWITPGKASVPGDEPPPRWRSAPRRPRGEPRWARWDAPGNLWVTDGGAPEPPGGAGVVASGGEAIPGPVGVRGGRLIVWDGTELLEGGPAPPGRVAIADELPAALRRLVTIWAEERGFELTGAGGDAALQLRVVGGEAREELRAGRGGWELTGVAALPGAPAEDGEGPLEAWLQVRAGGPVLVSRGPGRIVSAWREITSIDGDPATFAASWAGLLDSATLSPPGVLSCEEREAVGGARRIEPTPAIAGASPGTEEVGIEAWLALAAAILSVLAWSGGGRTRGATESRRTTT